MSLGLESGAALVVAYDDAWPALYATEAARIQSALYADLALAVEHVGSTAVPGLAAKPVLDILAAWQLPEHRERIITALERLDYLYRGEQGIPGRDFFRRGNPRSYHIHLAKKGGEFWRDHLAFRDALRGNAALRDEYAALKFDLARRYPRDREAYIEGKSEFVKRVLRDANQRAER